MRKFVVFCYAWEVPSGDVVERIAEEVNVLADDFSDQDGNWVLTRLDQGGRVLVGFSVIPPVDGVFLQGVLSVVDFYGGCGVGDAGLRKSLLNTALRYFRERHGFIPLSFTPLPDPPV